jgi:hypothetical protein
LSLEPVLLTIFIKIVNKTSRKFSIDDLKLILDNVNKEILLSDGITGMTFEQMINILNKLTK